jgi:hypothetical protein
MPRSSPETTVSPAPLVGYVVTARPASSGSSLEARRPSERTCRGCDDRSLPPRMQAVSQGLSAAAQDALRAALEPGEAICAFVTGFAGSAIVVTDRRVHFFARRPGTKGALRSWPVGAVVDIERPQFSLTIVLSGASPKSLVPTMIPSLHAPVDEVRDALRAAHRQHPVLLAGAVSATSVSRSG